MCFALPKENVGVRVGDQVKGLNLLGRGGGEEEDGKGEDQKEGEEGKRRMVRERIKRGGC